ncbi:MAG: tetratricopeptide repeat protein [Deltaproteobacteria bacterium]|nr:tetratricopeptide repeat protein [Deltaproteobacteria bacterium]
MRYLWLAVIVFALLGASSCGVVEVRDPNVLSYNEHMKLGAIYESKGEYELALREYEGALAIDKKEPGARFAMGNVRLKMKDYSRAEEEFLKSIDESPSPDAYNNLSWVYMEQGRVEDARKFAVKAVGAAEPEKGYIYLDTLGVALTAAGEYEEAEESFMKAADGVTGKKKEAYIAIYGHLIELYKKEGQTEKASVVEEKLKLFEAVPVNGPGPVR